MLSEELVNELASIIRRQEHRIRTTPRYSSLLQVDTSEQSLALTLEGIEDAIAGLVMLHIQVRRNHQ